jgi:hypothetical protein
LPAGKATLPRRIAFGAGTRRRAGGLLKRRRHHLACCIAWQGSRQNQLPPSGIVREAEVNKMRNVYKAPVGPGDVAAITDYLVRIKEPK